MSTLDRSDERTTHLPTIVSKSRSDDGLTRRALCLSIRYLTDSKMDEVDHHGSKDELCAALRALGYAVENVTVTEGGDFDRAIQDVLDNADASSVELIHILGHASRRVSDVRIVDGHGSPHHLTLRHWVECATEIRDRSPVLFLIDTCFAGAAVPECTATNDDTTWVIASSRESETSFNANFTMAVASVLKKIIANDDKIDWHSGHRYIPLGAFVAQIRQNMPASDYSQTPKGTRFDGEPPALPFFHNPRFKPASSPTVRPALFETSLIDPVMDIAHYFDRASGGRAVAAQHGLFRGRKSTLSQLNDWIVDARTSSGSSVRDSLALLTGKAGSGKSATLGVIACKWHPLLAGSVEQLLEHVPPVLGDGPAEFAIAHARDRTVTEVLGSVLQQLLPGRSFGSVDRIWEAWHERSFYSRQNPPLVVIDAIDESLEGAELLSAIERSVTESLQTQEMMLESAGIKFLLGVRTEFLSRVDTAAMQYDLDAIEAGSVRDDLQDYIKDSIDLRIRSPRGTPPSGLGSGFARLVTDRLLESSDGRGGEFFSAGDWLGRCRVRR